MVCIGFWSGSDSMLKNIDWSIDPWLSQIDTLWHCIMSHPANVWSMCINVLLWIINMKIAWKITIFKCARLVTNRRLVYILNNSKIQYPEFHIENSKMIIPNVPNSSNNAPNALTHTHLFGFYVFHKWIWKKKTKTNRLNRCIHKRMFDKWHHLIGARHTNRLSKPRAKKKTRKNKRILVNIYAHIWMVVAILQLIPIQRRNGNPTRLLHSIACACVLM